MGKYINDARVVLTLDAGGNSMRFCAMKGEEFVMEPLVLPSNANDLDLCLETMVTGFKTVINQLGGLGGTLSGWSVGYRPGPRRL